MLSCSIGLIVSTSTKHPAKFIRPSLRPFLTPFEAEESDKLDGDVHFAGEGGARMPRVEADRVTRNRAD